MDAVLFQAVEEGVPRDTQESCGLDLVLVGLLVGGGDEVFDHLVKADT